MGRNPVFGRMSAREIITGLLLKPVSKYQIAKAMGVSWRAVENWYTEKTLVAPEKLDRLQDLSMTMSHLWTKTKKPEIAIDNNPFAD